MLQVSDYVTLVGMAAHYYPPHAVHMYDVPPPHFHSRISIQ